jgi:hypothetical protein
MYEHKRGRESRERVEQGDGVVVVVVGVDVIGRAVMRVAGWHGARGGVMSICSKWQGTAKGRGSEDSR